MVAAAPPISLSNVIYNISRRSEPSLAGVRNLISCVSTQKPIKLLFFYIVSRALWNREGLIAVLWKFIDDIQMMDNCVSRAASSRCAKNG